MKTIVTFTFSLLILFCFQDTVAQGRRPMNGAANMPKEAKVTGKIVDGTNGQPVPYVSVAIYHSKDSTLLTGALSDDAGKFVLQELPFGKFYLQITSVGYKKQIFSGIVLTPKQKIDAVGAIKINPLTMSLKGVNIVGTAPLVEYKIDKKVVDVAKNITAAGGTLADALQNAPSIQTDVQGNVTVRGSSNFTLLIDGKPSPVSGSEGLQQIPANLVQSVEIITNPSAKYEAEGSAGIINVIMKKQKIEGTSGMFTATAGTGNKYSANLSLNYKISKFNFTLGADYTDMKFAIKSNMNNTDTLGNQYYRKQLVTGEGNFHRKGKGLNGSIEYDIDKKNSLTLSGSVGDRSFSRFLTSNYHDEYINPIGTPTNVYYLNSNTPEFKRNYGTVNLDYLLKLNEKGHELSATAYYSTGPNDNLSNLLQDTTDVNWNSLGKTKIMQQSDQNSNDHELRTKIDYTLPTSKKGKLEAGYQGTYSKNSGNYSLLNYIGNAWVEDISQRDKTIFKDQIQAGYVTYSNSIPLFDFELGLRTEFENRRFTQEIQNQQFTINRIDFFPSVHLSKQMPRDFELQASYSRRINRPRDFYLNSFVLHLDPQTIRVGNPRLLPEFANSYELSLRKKLKDASYVSVDGFMRQTSDLIQQIIKFDQATKITTNTFENIDHNRSIGAEFMVYWEPEKWLALNSSFNISNYHLFGTPIPTVSNQTTTWNIRIDPTFHISKQTSVEVNYTYNAPTITAQGTRSGFYFSTVAVRHSMFKQKGSLTLQVRDLIGQTNFTNTTQSAHQYRYSNFKRESQVFLLTFSYRINNYKVKQGSRQNQNDQSNPEEEMNQGL